MPKKTTDSIVTVRITGPDCWDGDRHYLPGEYATVPATLANEWKQTERAIDIIVEVTDGNRPDSN
jgi:hypothetical protein